MRSLRTSGGRRLAALLCATLLTAACGDGPTEPRTTPFDAAAVADAVDRVLAPVDASADALAALRLASGALQAEDVSPNVLSDAAAPSRFLPAVPASPDAALAAGLPLFPENLLGKTFVWDPAAGRYVVDESRTGAPSDGVRFVYYAVDPTTHEPVEPLNELGHLDVTDRSGASAVRVGLKLVRTAGASPRTLMDYLVAVSYSVTSESLTLRQTAEGWLADDADRLEFDLEQAVTFRDDGTLGVDVDYALSLNDDVALRYEGTISLDLASGTGTLSGTVTAARGGDRSVLAFTVTEDETIDGTLKHNGETVVLISGAAENPTFTGPNGQALTAAEVAALGSIWDATEQLLAFVEGIFSPFGGEDTL